MVCITDKSMEHSNLLVYVATTTWIGKSALDTKDRDTRLAFKILCIISFLAHFYLWYVLHQPMPVLCIVPADEEVR